MVCQLAALQQFLSAALAVEGGISRFILAEEALETLPQGEGGIAPFPQLVTELGQLLGVVTDDAPCPKVGGKPADCKWGIGSEEHVSTCREALPRESCHKFGEHCRNCLQYSHAKSTEFLSHSIQRG